MCKTLIILQLFYIYYNIFKNFISLSIFSTVIYYMYKLLQKKELYSSLKK